MSSEEVRPSSRASEIAQSPRAWHVDINVPRLYGSCVGDNLYILTPTKDKSNIVDCNMCDPSLNTYLDRNVYIACDEDCSNEEDIKIINYNRNICIETFNVDRFKSYLDTCYRESMYAQFHYYLNLYMEDHGIDIIQFDDNCVNYIPRHNRIFIGNLKITIKYGDNFLSSFALIYEDFSPVHLYRSATVLSRRF